MNLYSKNEIKIRRDVIYMRPILFLLSFTFIYPQEYTYSLEDINISSDYYGGYISPSGFSGQITLHYFGHQN